MPQSPQLFASFAFTSTHSGEGAGPQDMPGALQVQAGGVPPQLPSGPQAWPQTPQFGSAERLTHAPPPQSAWPAGHWQPVGLQLAPVGHLIPQKRQLFGSLAVSTHTLPQAVWPAGHFNSSLPHPAEASARPARAAVQVALDAPFMGTPRARSRRP
jgi:hypothetical protein